MNLEEIKNNCETKDLSSIYIYKDDKCVWDYKAGFESIQLISDTPCLDDEKVSLQELLDYANDLEVPINILNLECEDERKQFSSYKWLENKIILSF